MTSAKITKPTVPLVDKDGMINSSWLLDLQNIAKQTNATNQTVGTYNKTVCLQLSFAYPENGTTVFIAAPFAWTIATVTTRTAAGTATVTVAGDDTLGGGSNAATTSNLAVSHTSGNGVAANGDVTVTLADVSSDCEGLSVTITGSYA
jgi:hypothetical protein